MCSTPTVFPVSPTMSAKTAAKYPEPEPTSSTDMPGFR
eukprot:Gb_14531 [translate_table: standard]